MKRITSEPHSINYVTTSLALSTAKGFVYGKQIHLEFPKKSAIYNNNSLMQKINTEFRLQ